MKKLLSAVFLILFLSTISFSQTSKIWEVNPSASPWLSTGHTTRGMTYNPVTGHVLVAARASSAIVILDGMNGDSLGTLDMTGISGGTYSMNIVKSTSDGAIYLCNLILSGTGFKIYRWADENASPTVAFNGDVSGRVGDVMTASGSGNGTVLFASGSSNDSIYVFTTTDGSTFMHTSSVKVPSSGAARGGIAAVSPGPASDLWINGSGTQVQLISSTGTVLDTVSQGAIYSGWHNVAYLKTNSGQEYIAVVGRNEVTADYGSHTQLFNVTDSKTMPVLVADMVMDGAYTQNTNATGDLSLEENGDGSITVYTLITNTGVAAFKYMPPMPDLYFSEYIEGSSNNKALEIFNGTGATVDLSKYIIAQSTNGSGWQYYHAFPAGAMLNNGKTWVMVSNQVNLSLFDTTNADEVLAYPDLVYFNGDDARGLMKIVGTDTVLIDVIGIPTVDPGTAWDVAGVTNATQNHTLVRKPNVMMGDTSWAKAAGTDSVSSEWLVYAQDDFAFLGSHNGPVLPVELTSFSAKSTEGLVELAWSTATEKNNLGFEVQRSKDGKNFAKIGFIGGQGNSVRTNSYRFTDKPSSEGKYYYRLKQIDYNGTSSYSNVVNVSMVMPKTFSLEQNYPNPFNPTTNINFNLAVDSRVTLKIFNILGQEVTTLINGQLSSGFHTVSFNAVSFTSGVYFYQLSAQGIDGNNFKSVKKMILNK